MSTPSATGTGATTATTATAARYADTLAAGFPLLRFPDGMEQAYRQVQAARSTDVVRRMLPWVTLLYGAATAVMVSGAVSAAFDTWLEVAFWPVIAALGWLWIARLTQLLARQPHLHIAITLGISLFATVRAIFVIGEQPGVVYVTYQVIYLLFIAFTVAQLRLWQAVSVVALTGVALAIDAFAEGLPADWLAFGQYFLASSLISAVIGYMMEHRERAEWLRGEQAAVEKLEMLALQRHADEESRRQALLGQYLERVAGNLTATEVAGRTLKFLVDHTGAHIGTVFLVDQQRLRRAASWALEGETRAGDDIGRGETLIGQVAENGRRLRLSHLPADYHPIRTATGSASPAELLVEPVRQQDATLAVIELGALEQFNEADVDVIDRISRAMAGTLVAANAREALARAGMSEFVI